MVLYKCTRGTSNARGFPTPDGFTVMAGSSVSARIAPSFELANKWYYQLRLRLVAEGIIKDSVFQEDYVFRSSTGAASVVMGLAISGRIAWVKEENSPREKKGEIKWEDEGKISQVIVLADWLPSDLPRIVLAAESNGYAIVTAATRSRWLRII